MSIQTASELCEHMMQDIYYAEQKLLKALDEMAEAASSPKLAKSFRDHRSETETQIERLERAFEMCDCKAKGEKCDAIEGLLKEAKSLIKETEKGALLDAALIAAAQKVEHYEIATYGTICEIARTLGFDDVADLLGETLDEEKACDLKLTEIAEGGVNKSASKAA